MIYLVSIPVRRHLVKWWIYTEFRVKNQPSYAWVHVCTSSLRCWTDRADCIDHNPLHVYYSYYNGLLLCHIVYIVRTLLRLRTVNIAIMNMDIATYRSRIGLFGPGRGFRGRLNVNKYNPTTSGSNIHLRMFAVCVSCVGSCNGLVH